MLFPRKRCVAGQLLPPLPSQLREAAALSWLWRQVMLATKNYPTGATVSDHQKDTVTCSYRRCRFAGSLRCSIRMQIPSS